jgi:hypothetical protein
MHRSLTIAAGLLYAFAACAASPREGFSGTGGWAVLLRSMGLVQAPAERARVIVVPRGTSTVDPWLARMDDGAVLLLEGDSPLARALGFAPQHRHIRVRKVTDLRAPGLDIAWKDPAACPVFRVPAAARVFATDGRNHTPLMAGLTRGRGAALWLAISPGPEGYERFPYLPQALSDLGVHSPFESRRLLPFFDANPRGFHIDAETLASAWRQAGIAAFQVGAWDFYETDPVKDRYLRDLIAACHRHLILVYAWLEPPHISRRFWADHPEWREKTARLKDASVDWRLLMNLANPACRDAALEGTRNLLARFDWDGVNLAELYFDGIEGIANLTEFTPLNDDVRREFRQAHGFDPIELFRGGRRDPAHLRTFLDYRAALAAHLQEEWIDALEKMRASKPGLDLVLTHVDDRFDTSMHDAIGADAARALRLLDTHAMTYIIEDPGTVWRLGPQRYAEIARRYAPLTRHHDRVGVDINVVERYSEAHPTSQQTGAELLELIHIASESFARVAYYAEASIGKIDQPFLASASAVVTRAEERDGRLSVESPYGVGVRWQGPAHVDGKSWPVQDGERVWLPPGLHVVESGSVQPSFAVLDFNGALDGARIAADGVEIDYHSGFGALALVNRRPTRLMVDGRDATLDVVPTSENRFVVRLPRGQHRAWLR